MNNKKGGVVIATNLKKVSETYDKNGNLVKRTEYVNPADRFKKMQEERAKKLGYDF